MMISSAWAETAELGYDFADEVSGGLYSVSDFGSAPRNCASCQNEFLGAAASVFRATAQCVVFGLPCGVGKGVAEVPAGLWAAAKGVFSFGTHIVKTDLQIARAVFLPNGQKAWAEVAATGHKQKQWVGEKVALIKKVFPALYDYFGDELRGKNPEDQSEFLCYVIGRVGFEALATIAGPQGLAKLPALLKAKGIVKAVPRTTLVKGAMDAERKLMASIYREYYREGVGARTFGVTENRNHIRRLLSDVRKNGDELRAMGINPGELELSIVVSDLAKNPKVLAKYVDEFAPTADGKANFFAAFLDHSNLGMREAEALRGDLAAAGLKIDDARWERVLDGVRGHDGPGNIKGTFWGDTYKNVMGKEYTAIEAKQAYVHAWLDRLDQGGVYRSASGGLGGGPRKISYDVFAGRVDRPGVTGNLLETAKYSLDYDVYRKTLPQLEHLKARQSEFLASGEKLPKFITDMEKEMAKTPKYLERVVMNESGPTQITVRMPNGQKAVAKSLDEFWALLGRATK